MAELSTCPGCGRHCSINNLHCRRGEQIVKNMKAQESPSDNSKASEKESKPVRPSVEIPAIDQKLIDQLQSIGRKVSCLSEDKKDQELIDLFQVFSSVEKESLQSQLQKLKDKLNDIPTPKPKHGKHGSYHHKFHHKHRKHHH